MVTGTEIHGSVYDFVLSDNLVSTTGAETTIKAGLATRGIGNHHGLISETTVGPQFQLGLMLHTASQNEGGTTRKQVQELRLPPIPPRQSTGDYDFTHTDPLTKIVFSQDDWSGGGFQAVYDPKIPNKYANANGVDLRWESMAVPGMRLDHGHGDVTEEPVVSVGFLVRDPSFESSTLSDAWTTVSSPDSVSSVTTDPRSGDNSARHLRVDAADSGDGVEQALNNPTIYQGKTIVFHGYIKKVSGTGGVRLVIQDSGGADESSTVTDTSYTAVSVSRDIDGSASYVKIRVETTGDCVVDADDLAIIPTGGVSCKGTAVYGDAYYGIFGRVVAKFNGQNGTNGPQWDAVYINASAAATDIVTYLTNVYVAFGSAAAYVYGSSTSWTVSNLASDSKYAVHLAVSRATLWKSEDVNEIRSSTNPVNGGSWSSTYTVGSTDRIINNMYSFNDTIVVGKEDGLWWYKRTYNDGSSANEFVNQTNEYDKFQSTDNFSQGQDWLGWLWLIAANQSVYRTNLQTIQDITDHISSPLIDELSGRVRAITHDTHNLYMATENGLTGTDGRTTLISLRNTARGLVAHPLDEVLMTTVEEMDSVFVTRGTDGTRPFVFLMGLSAGGVTDSQKTYAWYIPKDSQSPVQSSDVKTNLYPVSFDTSAFHGGTPHETKSLVSATLWTDDHTDEQVALSFGADGQSPNAVSAFTFDGPDNVETLYFENIANPVVNAKGRVFQFRWSLSPDSTNAIHTRKIRGFAVEMTLRPERVRAWRMFFIVGGARLRNGANQDDVIGKSEITSLLGTLEEQGYPIVLNHDFEQDGSNEQVRVIIRPGTLRQTFQFDDTPEGSDIWEAVLQHVPTS